eukprot:3278719-Amphidinium_carterae.1
MEPESLRSSGYEIPESSGVRDKLDISAKLITTIGALSVSDHKISRIPVSMMFVCAAGYAPVRAAASQATEVVSLQDSKITTDADTYEIMRKFGINRRLRIRVHRLQYLTITTVIEPKTQAKRFTYTRRGEDSTPVGTAGQSRQQGHNRDSVRGVKYVADHTRLTTVKKSLRHVGEPGSV